MCQRNAFHPITLLCLAGLLGTSLAGDASGQNDLTDIPTPDPVAEAAAMRLHDGAQVQLFGGDPDIAKPIQMNFDSKGGLWISSSEVYPQIEPGQEANDKIVVLRDTDSDGVSDSATVFADGLLIPTGVLPDGPHAAYVAESTRLLYLEDTDGDGRADRRRVLLSGFGTEDTHHLIHTLRFGPDGCVYFNQSIYIHSHVDTLDGSRHLDGGGIWRYRPTTNELEIFCKGFINPWGHSFDTHGESFVTDGAFFEGINYTFPDAVFVTSPGASRWLAGMNPGSPKHCGLEILSGTHIPPEWAGSLVTSDFRSHRVCRFSIKPSASGYISRQQPEIITTPHVAFRPIDARMGPDGALYVADWYNPIIQHGEVDFRDPRRDRTHGRIWRVSFDGRPLDPWPDFSTATTGELITMLEDPSLAVAQFARQELWKRLSRDEASVMSAMRSWTAEKPSTRTNEWLWINEVAAETKPDEVVGELDRLSAIDPAYRRAALRSIWRQRLRMAPESAQRIHIEKVARSLTSDAEPTTRLEAVVSVGQLSGTEAMTSVLAATDHSIDANLDFAIWQSVRAIAETYAADHGGDSILDPIDWADRPAQLAYAVSAISSPAAAETALRFLQTQSADGEALGALVDAIAGAGDADQLGRLAKILLVDKKARSLALLAPLVDRTTRDKIIPAGIGPVLGDLVTNVDTLTSDSAWAETVTTVAAAWNVRALEDVLFDAIESGNDELRSQSVAALGALNSPTAIAKIRTLADSTHAATRIAAVAAMVKRNPGEAIGRIAAMLAAVSADDKVTAKQIGDWVAQLANRKEAASRLSSAIERVSIDADVARMVVGQVRAAGGNTSIEGALATAGKLQDASWKLSPEWSSSIIAKVQSTGSAERGEAIYRRAALQCVNCHAIGSAGSVVGPNLISLGGSAQLDYIVESLIDPSAKLKEGYTTLSVLTDDGQLINGIVIGKDDEAVRLRLADGKEVRIDADSIEQEKPGKSLMPAGLVDSLTESELVDLIAFMSALGRTAEFTVSTQSLLRSFETLVFSPEANRKLNRTSTDTVAGDDPDMLWRPMTATVNGTIPLSELDRFQQHKQTPPTSFIRFDVKLSDDGNVAVKLPAEGIDAWVDGKPTPIWELADLNLSAGQHRIVLAFDRSKLETAFGIELAGDVLP
ncbi:Membrane bound L-sorbosone dehydrogenase [Rubripirellula tenax]|uniref:Membrane bound L-sorbosone dehydrogenase n=1 Tax=Rubripirellula tenax TaxID=2528015 RepID=A0A5C6FHA0_9BACT|nr:PVC-type heme-binding CxxCH protein [Rubripirellula tenax]TWU60245.1 Membrane bound L-sorbosone dehydrogenase [Rubripirellula tenax]